MAFSHSIAPALKRRTADGAEAPYSGASGTMRQRAESHQPTFWDCTRSLANGLMMPQKKDRPKPIIVGVGMSLSMLAGLVDQSLSSAGRLRVCPLTFALSKAIGKVGLASESGLIVAEETRSLNSVENGDVRHWLPEVLSTNTWPLPTGRYPGSENSWSPTLTVDAFFRDTGTVVSPTTISRCSPIWRLQRDFIDPHRFPCRGLAGKDIFQGGRRGFDGLVARPGISLGRIAAGGQADPGRQCQNGKNPKRHLPSPLRNQHHDAF